MSPRKIHFAAAEPLSEVKSVEAAEPEAVQIPREGAESGEAAAAQSASPAPAETKAPRKSQKRCVVCKRGVENCECKGGPLTREEYEAVIAARSGDGGKTAKKRESNPQSVEDMARTLLFFYSKGGSWLSALACKVPVKKTDEIWAISEDKCAEILPQSITVLEKYWDRLPDWLTFLQEHLGEFMLGKALIELTFANIHATVELRREFRALSAVSAASIPKSKANGAAEAAIEQVQ